MIEKLKEERSSVIISQLEMASRLGVSRDKLLRDIKSRKNLYNELVSIGFIPKGRHGFYPKEVAIIEKYLVK